MTDLQFIYGTDLLICFVGFVVIPCYILGRDALRAWRNRRSKR